MNRYLGIVLLAVFLQAPTGDCLGSLGSVVGALPSSYPASNDPGQKAAEASDDAASKANEAKDLREKATSKANLAKQPPDYTDIDKAIALRPGDWTLYGTKAAMLRAEGKDSAANELDEIAYARAGIGFGESTGFFYSVTQVSQLARVLENMPANANRAKVADELCAQIRLGWSKGAAFEAYDGGRCGDRAEYRK